VQKLKLKRFCCSSCPYRSNFRSDVVRHIRHKHPTVACAAGVSKLDPASAAATLDDYMNTWARKKFVLHSKRRRRGAPHQHVRSTHPTVATSTPPLSVQSTMSFASASDSRVQLPTSEVAVAGAGESTTTTLGGSEDHRLVIDTESEDYDDNSNHATPSRQR